MEAVLERERINEERVRSIVDLLTDFDLSPVDSRVIKKVEDSDYLRGLRGETVKFLGIAGGIKGKFAPSNEIDVYWHELVLNTPLYRRLSERIGSFVDHVPSDRPEIEAYKKTIAAYRSIFGEPDAKFWPTPSAADCSSGDGGSCGSYCSGG
ncbi:hypothetical protein J4211_05115 [Candidatus Woesearchaeota archaeon]|nr:hypothetical protein [Candidatus Woesearchaeota archaeon]